MIGANAVELDQWLGRRETVEEVIAAEPARRMAATLDLDADLGKGTMLPPAWHWLYFLNPARASAIGRDGHPARGGFLPPIPLPRRMWAGGWIEFLRPIRIGETLTRVSEVASIEFKTGRTGPLGFVKVLHAVGKDGDVAIREQQDIVYREPQVPGSGAERIPAAPPNDVPWRKMINPDPVLLFRYSALTFNAHRIHYDRPYATGVEGYSGLVVHGPLVATLLLELVRSEWPRRAVTRFTYRSVRPLFDGTPFDLRGRPNADATSVHLTATTLEGIEAMVAEASVA